jgi:RNA polymerase sigma-70 factor (ECF subfamily)
MTAFHFEELFSTYEKPIRNYILRMVRETSVAEDLTQEVFLKIFNNPPSFQGEPKLSTWIYKVATNACLDYFRSSSYKKCRRTQLLDTDDSMDYSSLPEDERVLSVQERVIKEEMGECVQDYVDTLPEDHRAVIILHDLHGLKNREVAEILGCTLETVKIRLHRARRKLKAMLESGCDFYHDDNNVLGCDKKAD